MVRGIGLSQFGDLHEDFKTALLKGGAKRGHDSAQQQEPEKKRCRQHRDKQWPAWLGAAFGHPNGRKQQHGLGYSHYPQPNPESPLLVKVERIAQGTLV